MFTDSYRDLFDGDDNWKKINIADSDYFDWQEDSTYIHPSPFFEMKVDSSNKVLLHKPFLLIGWVLSLWATTTVQAKHLGWISSRFRTNSFQLVPSI